MKIQMHACIQYVLIYPVTHTYRAGQPEKRSRECRLRSPRTDQPLATCAARLSPPDLLNAPAPRVSGAVKEKYINLWGGKEEHELLAGIDAPVRARTSGITQRQTALPKQTPPPSTRGLRISYIWPHVKRTVAICILHVYICLTSYISYLLLHQRTVTIYIYILHLATILHIAT